MASALLFLAFLAVFMEVKASRELSLADALAARGLSADAAVHYFRSLNWYSPLGSSQNAAGRLAALGDSLEAAGDREGACLAFLRLRSALCAARSFYMPRRDLLELANGRIADCLARERLGPAAAPEDLRRERGRFLAIYSAAPVMNEGWYLAAAGGFLIWTLGGVLAVFRFFKAEPSLPFTRRLHAARAPSICFAAGYALWILGMAFA
ncbi:MAG: hypothetical protein LBW85_05030 [Deltaproteobacteria bacterium]|nr:hypothetical protein [Deltaproteobacteria bacterium]